MRLNIRDPSIVDAMKLANIIPKGRGDELEAWVAFRAGVQKKTNLRCQRVNGLEEQGKRTLSGLNT